VLAIMGLSNSPNTDYDACLKVNGPKRHRLRLSNAGFGGGWGMEPHTDGLIA